MFRTLLFSRIVPCVKDIGLWGPKVRHAYADLGVLDAAQSGPGRPDARRRADRRTHGPGVRRRVRRAHAEVDAAITEGSAS
jgi:hypothetical protein